MEYKQFGDTIVLRLDPGDEIMGSLAALAGNLNIHLATVQGLGACNEVELALYDVEQQIFNRRSFAEPLEMTSIDGNISEMAGETYLHIHANFGRADQSVIGGHLAKAVISGTAEIFIRTVQGSCDREQSKQTGLNVLTF